MEELNAEMKKCPLCGAEVGTRVLWIEKLNQYGFSHCCYHNGSEEPTVFISIYADTKEEIVERWNNRISE